MKLLIVPPGPKEPEILLTLVSSIDGEYVELRALGSVGSSPRLFRLLRFRSDGTIERMKDVPKELGFKVGDNGCLIFKTEP